MKKNYCINDFADCGCSVTAAKEAKTAQEPNATVLQKKAAATAGLPLTKTIDLGNEVNMAVVFIPAGEFDMGSPMDEPKRDSDEAQHHIKLTKPFYIGKFEVTQLQYRVIVNENPSKFGGDKLPVDNVNWYEASRFLKKLSDKTNLKFRLPTEAEWEYACRAGTKTAFNTGTTLDSATLQIMTLQNLMRTALSANILKEQLKSGLIRQTRSACMICTAMSGNGAAIFTTRIITR